jgi:hypothetical protein
MEKTRRLAFVGCREFGRDRTDGGTEKCDKDGAYQHVPHVASYVHSYTCSSLHLRPINNLKAAPTKVNRAQSDKPDIIYAMKKKYQVSCVHFSFRRTRTQLYTLFAQMAAFYSALVLLLSLRGAKR